MAKYILLVLIVVLVQSVNCGRLAKCWWKGKPKKIAGYFSSFLWWIRDFSGQICGDRCSGYDGQCQCGNETFDKYQNFYCCIPKNSTCTKKGVNVNCTDGQKLSWGEKCDVQDDCPVSDFGHSAISSDCSAPDNVHCPQEEFFSKVCQVDISNDYAGKNMTNSSKFAKQYCGLIGKTCKPSHGPFHHQCYRNR